MGKHITFTNDSRAFILSEAVFGLAKGYRSVFGLTIGTGTGGGSTYNGVLLNDGSCMGGEFGHISAPAHIVKEFNLLISRFGCGKLGCIETLVSGPGMTRIAYALTGQSLTPTEINRRRHCEPHIAKVWDVWCALSSELCLIIDCTINPDVIVLSGGVSNMRYLIRDLLCRFSEIQLDGFSTPKLLRAQGDGISDARGAAYAVWLDVGIG